MQPTWRSREAVPSVREVIARTLRLVVSLGAIASSLTTPVSAADETKFVYDPTIHGVDATPQWVQNEFIVVIKKEARGEMNVRLHRAGRLPASVRELQTVFGAHGVTQFVRQFPSAKAQDVAARFPDLTGHYKVLINRRTNLDAAINSFARLPMVDHVEKIGIHPVFSCATGTPNTPNDLFFNSPPPTFNFPQWNLWNANGIDSDLAWSLQTGAGSVVVVGADTGVRYYHGDLGGSDPPGPADPTTNGNVWVNPFEIPGNGIDDEGNGKIDDVVGWDFVTNPSFCTSGEDCATADNDPRDHHGHGTHTAGTMAAMVNNARDVAGITGGFGDGTIGSAGNGAKVMCLRIGWTGIFGKGYVRMDWAAEAMNYASDMKERGVNVVGINCSWGSSNSGGINAAVDNALAHDIMVIHSAGNGNSNAADFLGNKAGVMNVAATDKNGFKAAFSNFGPWVDLAAPGVEIISTWHNRADPGPDYVAVTNGTSMSAPHCLGVAALLESCNPSLTGPQKFELMVNSACPVISPNIGGLLNAKKALDAAGCGAAPECLVDADCDDGNVCTVDACGGGVCTNLEITCNDGSACTSDSCNPVSGCAFMPINCNDGNVCTWDSCHSASGCVHTPNICYDGNICTSDACDPASGCTFKPDSCQDDNACTWDVCDPLTGCVSTPVNCDDGDSCTTDSCHAEIGCVNKPVFCGLDDGCCPPGCSGETDSDCPFCASEGAPCSSDQECCSKTCRAWGGLDKTCRSSDVGE